MEPSPTDQTVAAEAMALFRRGLRRDQAAIDAFCRLVADDAVLAFPAMSHMGSRFIGPAGARDVFAGTWTRIPEGIIADEPAFTLTDGPRSLFLFADRGERADGSWYRNSVAMAFEIADGRIARMWEFLGAPGYFGDAA